MIMWEQFDKNEWFVLGMLVASFGAVFLLPRKIPKRYMVLGLVWGFASSMLFDFTIGGGLMDYYRVNDSNRYELTDVLTYMMFAPFGYIFIYFYEVLRINKKTIVIYILGWSIVGVGVQLLSEWMGMTHYQHGYRLEYNFAVFLVTQTITAFYYNYLKNDGVQVTHI